MDSTREWAEKEDLADPLSTFREEFLLPDGVIQLNGNSLGPLPRAVPGALDDAVRRQWGAHLIRGWSEDGWWDAPVRVGDRIGRLIGAGPGQTVVGDTTSSQLFNALTAAARLVPGRRVLVCDAGNFPTDRYVAASVARVLDLRLVEAPMSDLAGVLARHRGEVGAVLCGAVDFRTGELWDVARTTADVHAAGGVAVWDLSHATGAVPVAVDDAGVDLAVGCGYKYLCGGPGAPAHLYAAARHHGALDLPLTGWHGHARPFDMADAFVPAPGVDRARTGTPHVLSLLALEAALAPLEAAGVAAVRRRSLRLGDYLVRLLADLRDADDAPAAARELAVVTPSAPGRRGNHLTLRHPEAPAVAAALGERGVVSDARPPDLLRWCLNGLYVSHTDVFDAVAALRDVLAERPAAAGPTAPGTAAPRTGSADGGREVAA
ncbi:MULTISPECIES: aminotransferase class V-fold PLP-dependent enzyme [Streptomyces]|uniref:aminotransferase class V-fold PLP-dependent enzyme n=1 Tax=Streptomyces TaxID=1883 RepID=UPI002248FBC9|nr:aminotransferase class V-fold PLP-dependent enzyme [Streptomyces sp. JHD 1]MCX2968292.1 aminotransferase class V-fold PLP-dependent enzyme [Streptomyces sp. JHD 1]